MTPTTAIPDAQIPIHLDVAHGFVFQRAAQVPREVSAFLQP